MANIINWCNNNSGFTSAVLSVVGLFISGFSMVVSIRTSRLPYKKKIRISSMMDIRYTKDNLSGKVSSSIVGISVKAVNIGNRTVNLDYLGFRVKKSLFSCGIQKMAKTEGEITGEGPIKPTEIKSEQYTRDFLLYALDGLPSKAMLYLFATDTEGKKYMKKLGLASDMHRSLI